MESNQEMVSYLLRLGIITQRIAECMLAFPRADFFPKPLRKSAYADTPAPISNRQTTSAPSMVGIMLSAAEIKEGTNILEIGTGSGWQTALLSCLVGPMGKVHSLDIYEEIYANAKKALSNLKNVELLLKNGLNGHSEAAPYDLIIVGAAATEPPPSLLSQLKEGGILIIPLKEIFAQSLFKITKTKKGIQKEQICPVLFVPMYEGGDGNPH